MKTKLYILISLLVVISMSCSFPTPSNIAPSPTIITDTVIPPSETPSMTPTVENTATVTLTLTPEISDTPTSTPTLGPAMITPNTTTNVNCRFGPSLDYLTTGALIVGESVPILGKLADQSWWQINSNLNPGTKCWVSAAVTTASGKLASVPVKSGPAAQVISASITAPDTIHGHCGGPNPTSFEVSITTNGPASVKYHVSVFNSDGTLRNQLPDETLSFASADTKTFDPAGAYKTDCGDFYAKVVVSSPNSMSDRVDWTVVEP
ncbi:MAG: hypothetical protein JEZ00_07235 [Anaerolineaceae bacterium]|nr:hypothetical protein [Anaerolineaceae bacterium]